MQNIVAKYAGGMFSKHEVAILIKAFDQCWEKLEKSGARYGSDRALQTAREQLGKGIIEAAKRGERDPLRLCEDAMLHFAKAGLLPASASDRQ